MWHDNLYCSIIPCRRGRLLSSRTCCILLASYCPTFTINQNQNCYNVNTSALKVVFSFVLPPEGAAGSGVPPVRDGASTVEVDPGFERGGRAAGGLGPSLHSVGHGLPASRAFLALPDPSSRPTSAARKPSANSAFKRIFLAQPWTMDHRL